MRTETTGKREVLQVESSNAPLHSSTSRYAWMSEFSYPNDSTRVRIFNSMPVPTTEIRCTIEKTFLYHLIFFIYPIHAKGKDSQLSFLSFLHLEEILLVDGKAEMNLNFQHIPLGKCFL